MTPKLHRLRLHGCVWDRECRSHGAPRRIYLHAGRHSWWVDLPGHDKARTFYADRACTEVAEHMPASWQLLPQFGHDRREKRQ